MRRLRVLLIDAPDGALSHALQGLLRPHAVEIARDALDAIYRIDCATRSYDLIFCDAGGALPGPLLWAHLAASRSQAARRFVLVASGPIDEATQELLEWVRAPCVHLETATRALSFASTRRASRRSPRGRAPRARTLRAAEEG